jgi:hypothetical protein
VRREGLRGGQAGVVDPGDSGWRLCRQGCSCLCSRENNWFSDLRTMATCGGVGRRDFVWAGVSAFGPSQPKWFSETTGAGSVVPGTSEERVRRIRVPIQLIALFAACLIILAENQHPTAPRLLLSCMDHIIIGRLIILLHRKGREIRSSPELRSQSTVRRA